MVCQGSLNLMIKCNDTSVLGKALSLYSTGSFMLYAVRYIEPPFPPLCLIKDNRAVSCQYEDPFFPSSFVFEATLLPGAEYVLCCMVLTRIHDMYNLYML